MHLEHLEEGGLSGVAAGAAGGHLHVRGRDGPHTGRGGHAVLLDHVADGAELTVREDEPDVAHHLGQELECGEGENVEITATKNKKKSDRIPRKKERKQRRHKRGGKVVVTIWCQCVTSDQTNQNPTILTHAIREVVAFPSLHSVASLRFTETVLAKYHFHF